MHKACLLSFIILLLPVCFVIFPAEPVRAGIFDRFINMQIEPLDDPVASIAPLEMHEFHFRYYNGGILDLYNFKTEFWVNVTGEGWAAYVQPATPQMTPPDAVREGWVTVSSFGKPSNTAAVTVTGRFKDIYGNWYYGNYTFHVVSAQYHRFNAFTNRTIVRGQQEKIYNIPITIINNGNQDDQFVITPAYYPQTWHVTISQSPVIILSGEQTTVIATFSIPHEKIYTQPTMKVIQFNVKSTWSGTTRPVAVIVSIEGAHFTLGQTVALLSSAPSLIMLAFVGIVIYSKNSPYGYLPRPWREEKDEIDKLDSTQRRQIKKCMKEEWKSSKYYLKSMRKEERFNVNLEKIRHVKQKKLEHHMQDEWKKSWKILHEAWQIECNHIRREHEKCTKRITEKIKKVKGRGIAVDITLPQPCYPPEPKQQSMPQVPKYHIDERRNVIIEPDEIDVERQLIPLKRAQRTTKQEINQLKVISKENISRLRESCVAIEQKIDDEIRRTSARRFKKEARKKKHSKKPS